MTAKQYGRNVMLSRVRNYKYVRFEEGRQTQSTASRKDVRYVFPDRRALMLEWKPEAGATATKLYRPVSRTMTALPPVVSVRAARPEGR